MSEHIPNEPSPEIAERESQEARLRETLETIAHYRNRSPDQGPTPESLYHDQEFSKPLKRETAEMLAAGVPQEEIDKQEEQIAARVASEAQQEYDDLKKKLNLSPERERELGDEVRGKIGGDLRDLYERSRQMRDENRFYNLHRIMKTGNPIQTVALWGEYAALKAKLPEERRIELIRILNEEMAKEKLGHH